MLAQEIFGLATFFLELRVRHMDAFMSPAMTPMYRCGWCERCVGEQDKWFKDLRAYYKVSCPQRGWFYGWTGLCERCAEQEWKEFRREESEEQDEKMKHLICQRALDSWGDRLADRLEKELQMPVHVEYRGNGGREKAARKKSKRQIVASIYFWLDLRNH